MRHISALSQPLQSCFRVDAVADIEFPEDDDKSVVLERARKNAAHANDMWREIYNKAKEDLRFLSDDPSAQWDAQDYETRTNRKKPVLTVDQLMQFVNQVSNNIRMNTPSINVIPNDQDADETIAQIFKGRIKDIEHQSKADDAYDTAVNSAIKCSIGFIRIDHRYKDDASFEQEIVINRVVNPFSILIDPNSIEPDGSDAEWAIVIDEMTESDFERQYPEEQPVSFDLDLGRSSNGNKNESVINVVEYFEIEREYKTVGMTENGDIEEMQENKPYMRTRKLEKRIVHRYKMSGEKILESTTFPGKYIPIIPVYGEEAWEAGQRKINSLIRRSKDAQRMFNYWKTMEAELLIRAPKATAIAPVGTTEDFAEDWLNPEKAAVLRYTPKTAPNGSFYPAPQLTPPPQVPVGISQASLQAQQDIKTTLGLYNAYMGDRSNEQSGVAINARKIQGEAAVYHFGDNLVRSIAQCGRVLVSMIPIIDSEPKLVRVIGEEGETELVGINGALAQGQEQTYDLSRGQYSIRVTTGGSTPTMRQEAALLFKDIVTSQPEMMAVVGDLMFKYQDFPGAQAVSERLKAILRPEIKAATEGDNPEMAQVQAENQQLQQAIQQLQAEMQSKQTELQMKQQEINLKAHGEQADNQLEIARLQLDEARLSGELRIKEQEIALKAKELELKEAELIANQANRMAGVVAQPVTGQQGQVTVEVEND